MFPCMSCGQRIANVVLISCCLSFGNKLRTNSISASFFDCVKANNFSINDWSCGRNILTMEFIILRCSTFKKPASGFITTCTSSGKMLTRSEMTCCFSGEVAVLKNLFRGFSQCSLSSTALAANRRRFTAHSTDNASTKIANTMYFILAPWKQQLDTSERSLYLYFSPYLFDLLIIYF